MKTFTRLPLRRVALWGVLLNAIWEFVQCTFLYDMGGWGFWKATAAMWSAILGDVLIVFGVVFAAAVFVGFSHLDPPDGKGWGALLAVGLAVGVALEWAARSLGLWSYGPAMPTLEIAREAVGLSPILQVLLLPAASVYLGSRVHWPLRKKS
jgi:hypothetical protein